MFQNSDNKILDFGRVIYTKHGKESRVVFARFFNQSRRVTVRNQSHFCHLTSKFALFLHVSNVSNELTSLGSRRKEVYVSNGVSYLVS